ncbi:MAG: RimK family alpha-L-glutamate ligase [Desulfacinum sp.]|jgi:ribosomal protein S6--L-glutamate ligase|nr:RimK family alpha-L-glutamate ligase [Desulfacinum sp.]
MADSSRRNGRLSLGKRLRRCPSFRCLGVHPNWDDYGEEEKRAIRSAGTIHYPSRLYEELFRAAGKDVFPGNYYAFMGNKIRQTQLFQLLGVPHPRTGIYYGKEREERILADFSFPLVAKTPVGSSQGQGVWRIGDRGALRAYLSAHNPAYVQEYLPIDRDLRVVLLARRVVHAYWRIARPGDFRNNVSCGGRISFEDIPEAALEFARWTACVCRFDEVGLDICRHDGRWWVLEANMAYGLEGFRRRGLNIHEIFKELDEGGWL